MQPESSTPPDPGSNRDAGDKRQTTAESIAKYSELALMLPAGAAAGWLIGAWVDHRLGTHWIYLLGLIIGFIGGFVRVIRVAMGKQ